MTDAIKALVSTNDLIRKMKIAFVVYNGDCEADRNLLKTIRKYCKMCYNNIKPHLDQDLPCLNIKYECAIYGHIYNKDYDKAVRSFDKLKEAFASSETAYNNTEGEMAPLSDKFKDFYISSKLDEFQVLLNYIKP